MKRVRIAVVCLVLLSALLLGCISEPIYITTEAPAQTILSTTTVTVTSEVVLPASSIEGDNVIHAIITDNGISEDRENFIIGNFHDGARVEIVYSITNSSSTIVRPTIYTNFVTNPVDYSKAIGYSYPPAKVPQWLTIPDIGTIQPNKVKDASVILEMPKDGVCTQKQWAFKTGIAGNNGGSAQTSVECWWLVTMR